MAELDPATEQELLYNDQEYLDMAGGAEPLNEEELLAEGKEETKENGGRIPTPEDLKAAEDAVKEEIDLYDEAVAPSLNNSSMIEEKPMKPSVTTSSSYSNTSVSSNTSGRYHCYIGNLTWWTTDADLAVNIAALGVNDVLETKFFENRITGQSKGFALVVFGSEASLRNVSENLCKRQIHGSNVCVLAYTKQSLARLEEACAKTQTRPDNKTKKEDSSGCVNMGTIRIGAGVPPLRSGGAQMTTAPIMNRSAGPLPLMINGQPQMQAPSLMNRSIAPPGVGISSGYASVSLGAPVPMSSGPRPLMGGVAPGMAQPLMNMRGMNYGGPQPLMQPMRGMGMPPPGAHVNPQVFPGMQQMGGPIPDAEFEEIMNRNRTVSSSAISRAVADAAAGDPKAAVETLMTAITLIKQSRVAHDDRCRLLIAGLQDTLSGIESKSGSYSSRSRHRDHRDRSRSRDRDRRRRRRSRSSSHSRSRSRSPRHRSGRHY